MSWTAYLLTSVLWLSWLSYRANATTTTHWVEWQWNRGIEHWAVSSFARTAHSLPFSALLARSTALIHSLTRSFSPELMRKIYFYELNVSISCHFNPLCSTSAPAAPKHTQRRGWNQRKSYALIQMTSKSLQQKETFTQNKTKQKQKKRDTNAVWHTLTRTRNYAAKTNEIAMPQDAAYIWRDINDLLLTFSFSILIAIFS